MEGASDVMTFSHDRIGVSAVGRKFETAAMDNALSQSFRTVRYRDALQVDMEGGEAWLFDYGIVAFWGVDDTHRKRLLDRLKEFTESPLTWMEREHYHFAVNAGEDRIQRDHVALQGEDPLKRLAVSHALAQSVQLNVFEDTAQRTIGDTEQVPRSLASKGRTALGRKKLARMRGVLFSTKSDIILHYELLDTPEFFWDYPEYEAVYQMVARYLEVKPRVELLTIKLATISELLEMLADEVKHQHSATLEWIIIILIAIEIVIFVGHELATM